jgi:ribosomal protein S18 acetylase RimI-like enzyme
VGTVTPYTLRRLRAEDRAVVVALLEREWGAVEVVALSLGGIVNASTLPGWLAESDGEVVGLLTYLTSGDVVDIVTINAFTGGGVGAALVEALVSEVRGTAARLRVTTTNDNTRALRFYQRAGFRLTALRPGAVDESRKIKPEIPALGHDGIPIRDELELEMELSQ